MVDEPLPDIDAVLPLDVEAEPEPELMLDPDDDVVLDGLAAPVVPLPVLPMLDDEFVAPLTLGDVAAVMPVLLRVSAAADVERLEPAQPEMPMRATVASAVTARRVCWCI